MATTKTGGIGVDRLATPGPVIVETKLARPRARSEHVARPGLRAVLAEGTIRPLPALAAQATPGAGLVEVVLPLFLNDLAMFEQEIALVLDDYHLITNTEVHEA